MNKNVYIIVILAVIALILLQTVFFINKDIKIVQPNEDKCIKCHENVQNQLSESAQHSTFPCSNCHPKSIINHTNEPPECEFCHDTTKLSDPSEAHSDFEPLNSEGCIACHTNNNVIINYSRPEFISYEITNDSGNWVISNFTTIGMLNLSYNAIKSGENHNVKNVSCKECHKDIFEAVSAKGHAVVSGKDGKESRYHNTSNSTSKEAWCLTCHSPNDTKFPTSQHSARRITCEECHVAYNLSAHPGNFYTNIKTVPRLYRSLVCISCKAMGWQVPNTTLRFKVHQEPYSDVTMS
jgi:nitrate/TMAO reductase-like tetraheme cytochrome c subunit